MDKHQQTITQLLDRYGETYAREAGIKPEDKPAALFQLLVAANLFSARISAAKAVQACRAIIQAGYTTARNMADATGRELANILNANGYARYDEKTAGFLIDMSRSLMEVYGGDLRKLREDAGKDAASLRKALKQYKGIGDMAVDIFFREVQYVWNELYPFADSRSLKAAGKMGLPGTAESLADLVDNRDFPRLLAALVRADLNKDYRLESNKNYSLKEMNQTDLYEKAKKADIPGRSGMSKAQLIKALKEKGINE